MARKIGNFVLLGKKKDKVLSADRLTFGYVMISSENTSDGRGCVGCVCGRIVIAQLRC